MTEQDEQAIAQGLMTIGKDGVRRCAHGVRTVDWCAGCMEFASPEQLRLMGKMRAATLKEKRIATQ